MSHIFDSRRKVPRYPLEGVAEFELPALDLTLNCETLDISTRGVGLQIKGARLRRLDGQIGILTVNSPDLPAPMRCHASLIRQSSNETGTMLGLLLYSIDDANLALLRAYRALATARIARQGA